MTVKKSNSEPLSKAKQRRLPLVVYLWRRMMSDSIWDGAAILSFYFLLSSFPALLILIAVASYVPLDNFSEGFLQWSISTIPTGIRDLFLQVVEPFEGRDLTQFLSLGFFVALWTGISGVSAVIRQLNLVYHLKETRSYIKIKWISLAVSLALGVLIFAGFSLLLAGQFLTNLVNQLLPLPDILLSSLPLLRYVLMEGLLLVVFAMVYSLGPDRRKKLTLFSRGSVFGSLAFLLSTYGFAYYLNTYADYSAIYGRIGASIGLIIWFYILGFLLLFGAELNYASSQRYKK